MSYLSNSPKILYVQYLFNQVVNTATEITAIGTSKGSSSGGGLTLPANFFVPGKRLKVFTKGTYQTPTTPGAVTVKIKVGSTVIATCPVAASILATSSTVREMYGEAVISCQAVTSGVAKLVCDGFMTFEIAAGTTTVPFSTQASVAAATNPLTASTGTTVPMATIDYTVANAGLFDITETWSNAQAGQGTVLNQVIFSDESLV